MNEFEFFGLEDKTDEARNDNSSSDCVAEYSNPFDYVDINAFLGGKSPKKSKKAKKAAQKQKKKIKQLSSKTRKLKKEISALKGDMKTIKKSEYDSKLAEIVNCDNSTERKRLASELHRMEV